MRNLTVYRVSCVAVVAGRLSCFSFSEGRDSLLYDWGDSEMEDSPKIGELRFRSKTTAGPLEDK